MNVNTDGSASLGKDPMVLGQSDKYDNGGWVAVSPFSQDPYDGSPMNDYLGFATILSHGLASEMMAQMPQAPVQHLHQHLHLHQQSTMPHSAPMGHHQLPMLNNAWSSQVTRPTLATGRFSASPISHPPLSGQLPALDIPRSSSRAEKGRKTLSTEQKRRMCQYHEDNPGTRQADIGREFGVERSTVSKVLRNKDEYLGREQESDRAAVRRSGKARNPDFDRTLSNYIRRQRQNGIEIRDEDIMEQARLFSHATGDQDATLGALTSSWLQKFKQKHRIGKIRRSRRASGINVQDAGQGRTPNESSSTSPPNPPSPLSSLSSLSPLSPSLCGSQSGEEAHHRAFTHRQQHSHSTTSLAGDVQDRRGSSFSGGTLSPIGGNFHFSPDPNVGTFQPVKVPDRPQELSSHDYQYRGNYVAPVSSVVNSPANDVQPRLYALNTGLISPLSMQSCGHASGLTVQTSAGASPVSPTQEDARRAADTLLNYMQNSGELFQSSDVNAIMQLSKKLEMLSGKNSWGPPEGDCRRYQREMLVEQLHLQDQDR